MRVSAESRDIAAHPLDGQSLIEEAGVAFHTPDAVRVEEAQRGHAVLQRYDDDVLLRGQRPRIVHVQGGGAGVKRTAVDPHL